MTQEVVLLLHGFASSSNSRKAHFFRDKFETTPAVDFDAIDFNPSPNDFEFMTITGMINRLRQIVLDREYQQINLIGSSLGALVGLNYALRYGGVNRLFLLAPALSYDEMLSADEFAAWEKDGAISVQHYAFDREVSLRFGYHLDGQQYSEILPPPAPITIIHGVHDDVVPVAKSRSYAQAYQNEVTLVEVDSDHRLNDVLETIWNQWVAFET